MESRILYRLTYLAAAMSLGHHIDHAIRHNAVGWLGWARFVVCGRREARGEPESSRSCNAAYDTNGLP